MSTDGRRESPAATAMLEAMARDGKWAPWWVYVVLIIGCNFGKQRLLEGRVSDVANVAITVVMVALLITAITAIHRARPGRGAGTRP